MNLKLKAGLYILILSGLQIDEKIKNIARKD
jgi:hypothetical protein